MRTAPLTLSAKARRTPESPITHFMGLALGNPHLISLAAGMVDGSSLPAGPVAQAVADLLADLGTARAALQYGTTQGHGPLINKIIEHVAALDGRTPEQFGVTAKDVLVTTGSQQVLYMLGELLLDPGDIVITESPSYFVFHSVLAGTGARVLTVPMDDDGMITTDLVRLLERLDRAGELSRVKLIYTVDYFQNPTGLTLSADRRRHLIEIVKLYADRQRILILEDAAYRELRYEGDEIASVKSLDPDNRFVVYAGTFSKPCAPGLKTGYALMPTELMEPLIRMKGNHDFGSNNLSQHIIYKLLTSGAYKTHVEFLRGVYRKKRDAMLRALDAEFGDMSGATWTNPKGGMFVWLTLPDEIETSPNSSFLNAALEEGVLYVPGEFGHVSEAGDIPRNEARLSFGDANIDQIREGVRRLRRAADQVVRGRELEPAGV
ncbi:MAG TPA: PLP-dependent aminotransferase family protein [Gemmataceae bacterium]|nr:PLP-dependent aminotransferase family protein [Gemmataceae bacterium]